MWCMSTHWFCSSNWLLCRRVVVKLPDLEKWVFDFGPPGMSAMFFFLALRSLCECWIIHKKNATSCTCKGGVMVPWIFICCPLHYAPAIPSLSFIFFQIHICQEPLCFAEENEPVMYYLPFQSTPPLWHYGINHSINHVGKPSMRRCQ